MIRSMFAHSKLPIFHWGETLKTANYILNRVRSKLVNMVPFEGWTWRKPSFNHCHVWGCKAEARFYNPSEKKLDSRTTSCRFIGYSEKSKGFKFYCHRSHSHIMETHNAKFLEVFKETDLCSIATVSPEFEEAHLDDELLGHQETPMFTPVRFCYYFLVTIHPYCQKWRSQMVHMIPTTLHKKLKWVF